MKHEGFVNQNVKFAGYTLTLSKGHKKVFLQLTTVIIKIAQSMELQFHATATGSSAISTCILYVTQFVYIIFPKNTGVLNR